MADEGGDVTWRQYCDDFSKGLGVSKPWLRIPFWLAYSVGYMMELTWGLFGIKSRPLLTRHAVYLIGTDQFFPIGRSKKDFQYEEAVSYQEGLKRCVNWYKSQQATTQKQK